jgi:Holliday junction resolvase RusA-like endonuclease|tara:strand:+ start:2699 stop:3085 length:387 start_codon:yes stop_codon:yes gene_type:complete
MGALKNLTIILYDVPPAQIRGNTRAHFQTLNSIRRQRKETAMWLTKDAMTEAKIDKLDGKVHVEYMFYNNRDIDIDNLIFGMKATLDGIVNAGLIPDDSPSYVKITGDFEKCKKGEEKTVIRISKIKN